jgi:Transcriptional repressor TCF25
MHTFFLLILFGVFPVFRNSCVRTSTAVGQYLLAMDPLRDPMSVLVILDSLALTVQDPKLDRWIVELVQNNSIPLLYREKDGTEYAGTLTDMPNWAFSYALALYRIETSNNEDTLIFNESESAKMALMTAIRRFPSIVEELLRNNDVPTTGRSTYRDWPPVLDALQQLSRRRPTISFDPIQYHATKSVCDKLSKIYVQRSSHLWGSANTTNHNGQTLVTWLYEASHEVVVSTSMDIPVTPFSSALLRYWEVDETEFQNRFQLLPPEANPLDPNVLGLALHVYDEEV